LVIYRSQIRPQIRPYQVSDLISQNISEQQTLLISLLQITVKENLRVARAEAPSHFSEDQEVVAGFLQLQAPAVTEEPEEK